VFEEGRFVLFKALHAVLRKYFHRKRVASLYVCNIEENLKSKHFKCNILVKLLFACIVS